MGQALRTLLVEDEYMIAQDMAESLRALGAEIIGPVPSVPKALAAIEQETELSGALLDINLQGQMVFPVADRLLESNVPILFTTGYDDDTIPPRYSGVPRVLKPVTSQQLRKALAETLDLAR